MRNALNNSRRSEVRTITWLMGGIVVLAFIAGIMVDVDHPIALVLGIRYERFLHPYFGIVGIGFIGVGFILAITCLCRYLWLGFLSKHRR